MIRYVPSSAAEPLSAALYALSRPPQVRGPQDTTHLFGWVDDTQGDRWLVVDTDYEIAVHPEAELGEIGEILQPWVGHGITQEDIDALAAVVEGHRGGRMTPWEFFPALFKDLSKSHQEMIDAGLLAAPVEVEP